MSVITLTKESHKNPEKFRIKHQDEVEILGPHRKDRFAINEDLPTITTTSKIAILGAGFGGMASAIKTMQNTMSKILKFLKDMTTLVVLGMPTLTQDVPVIFPLYGIHFRLH